MIDTETHWEQAQWLLRDSLKPEDRLGREPVVLPEPLATLARQVAAARHGHAASGDRETSPWLFPGGQPGRPISAFRMAERLRDLIVAGRPGILRHLCCLLAQVRRAGPLAGALRSGAGVELGGTGVVLTG